MKKHILKKLIAIQAELRTPKGQLNKFGGYKYRSCEDILEAVKPHLAKREAVLVVSDAVVQIESRFYVEATATLYDVETGDSIEVKALAREEESKKGMDGSQITGAASSYARKYALNGLFAIDDTKDSDHTNVGDATRTAKPKSTKVADKPTDTFATIDREAGIDAVKRLLDTGALQLTEVQNEVRKHGYQKMQDMSPEAFRACVATLTGRA